MPWALTTFGPDGALIVMNDFPLPLMKPGVPFAVTYWPTIVPLSLIPNAVEDMLPLGLNDLQLAPAQGERIAVAVAADHRAGGVGREGHAPWSIR